MDGNFGIKLEPNDLEESPGCDDLDDLDELLKGAQEIIAEYRTLTDRVQLQVPAANTSQISEELSRQVEEILSQTVEDQTANDDNTPLEQDAQQQNNIRQEDDDDDDVVFISAEPRIDVIDLCSPFAIESIQSRTRRRRAASSVVEVIASSPDLTPKRAYNPNIAPNLNASTQEDCSAGGLKITCPVCMDSPVRREPMTTICGHIFCKKCIFQAVKCSKKCPLCNKKLSRTMVHRIYL